MVDKSAGGPKKIFPRYLQATPDSGGVLRLRNNLDLSMFTGLGLRLRGDGRSYICNLQTDGLRDDDLYQYFLYTRGGPDFQTFYIPFDEFLLTNQGYVQNEQLRLNARKIRTMGILLADRIEVFKS